MQQETKDIIIKNFLILIKECNINALTEKMISEGVFSTSEITDILSSADTRHNKRLFFFGIQKKEQRAFDILLDSLKTTNQNNIANILAPGHSGCQFYIDPNATPLDIKVVHSDRFYDTKLHNREVEFYSSRSKKRGRVLIINNYEYEGVERHRNGATADNQNLHDLFNQMGGWQIVHYDNRTAKEMNEGIKQFAQDTQGKNYDICFVIIMGHGNEISNRTIIYGIDEQQIYVDDIQKEFTNTRCAAFKGKPKIFLFQVCRGDSLDFAFHHTQTDSLSRESADTIPKSTDIITTNIRTEEDMLIGYATLHGYKAHRDPFRGSWYIELVCENFMRSAHNRSVDDLLILVDQGLRKRMSEKRTMQTAEHCNRGFKKLYLNPGIYYEEEQMKYFIS